MNNTKWLEKYRKYSPQLQATDSFIYSKLLFVTSGRKEVKYTNVHCFYFRQQGHF